MLDVDAPELFDDDRHHLERVLRLRPGDHLTVGDGAGRWRPCRFGDRIEPMAAAVAVEAPRPEVAVGFAVLKGGRSEHIVQKLTELGVDRIVPFAAERSVVRWDEAKAARQVERWRRVAREAVMQCRRLWLPHLEPARAFGDLDLSGAALAVPGGRGAGAGGELRADRSRGGMDRHRVGRSQAPRGAGPPCAAGRDGGDRRSVGAGSQAQRPPAGGGRCGRFPLGRGGRCGRFPLGRGVRCGRFPLGRGVR